MRRLFFFQGPIGRDFKTTVKIRNILFATFSHTYELLVYIVHAPTCSDIFRSVVPTFQNPCHRSQPSVLSTNSLCWSAAHCDKMLSSYDRFIQGRRWKSQGAKSGRMMVCDQTLSIKNASGASLLQVQYAAEYYHEEGLYLRTTSLVTCSEIELQHARHIWRVTLLF